MSSILHDNTRAWLDKAVPDLEMPNLIEHFPRILNSVALLWGDEAMTRKYLNELLLSTRPTIRQGFPPAVLKEIMELNLHHDRLYPVIDHSPWRVEPARDRIPHAAGRRF